MKRTFRKFALGALAAAALGTAAALGAAAPATASTDNGSHGKGDHKCKEQHKSPCSKEGNHKSECEWNHWNNHFFYYSDDDLIDLL